MSNFTDEQVFYDQLEIGFSSGSLRDIFAKLINELNSADNNKYESLSTPTNFPPQVPTGYLVLVWPWRLRIDSRQVLLQL